jgi:hypothetical protein
MMLPPTTAAMWMSRGVRRSTDCNAKWASYSNFPIEVSIVLDFTRYGRAVVARYVVLLKPEGKPAPVADRVARQLPGPTHSSDPSRRASAEAPLPPMLDIVVHLDSTGQAEDVQRAIGGLEGVEEVELLFPRRFYLYRTWLDEHIRAMLDRPTSAVTKVAKLDSAGA